MDSGLRSTATQRSTQFSWPTPARARAGAQDDKRPKPFRFSTDSPAGAGKLLHRPGPVSPRGPRRFPRDVAPLDPAAAVHRRHVRSAAVIVPFFSKERRRRSQDPAFVTRIETARGDRLVGPAGAWLLLPSSSAAHRSPSLRRRTSDTSPGSTDTPETYPGLSG